jgi:isoleucyl-tRNA synthetase
VHEANWQPASFERTNSEKETWNFMFEHRDAFMLPELERFRRAKMIGKSLDAAFSIKANGKYLELLNGHAEELRELVNVSQLSFEVLAEPLTKDEAGGMSSQIRHADGQKCERCWHWETDVGQNPEHPTICGRCIEAVKQFKA